MSRFSASGFHFFLSFLCGLGLLALCWFVWYPPPMMMAIGGNEIFLLVVGIDVVLGPLLTLIVFKSGKKSLRFDLAVIATLQIVAMAYGISTLLEGRPAFVAALGRKFQVVQASEVTDRNLDRGKTELPWWGPRWVGTKEASDRYDIDQLKAVRSFGADRGHLPQLHAPYASMTAEILKGARSIDQLRKINKGSERMVDEWLAERGYNDKTAVFQPIKINASEFVVILDIKSAAVIGIAPFKP